MSKHRAPVQSDSTDYEAWQRARADICLLFHEQMLTGRVELPRHFGTVFSQPYHRFLEGSFPEEPDTPLFQRGALLMLLSMALDDIQGHFCDYKLIDTDSCTDAVRRFSTPDRVTQRLADIVRLAFRILEETTLETRMEHPDYPSLETHLAWVHKAVVVDYYRSMPQRTHAQSAQPLTTDH
jgi:hypothetical protein